MRVLLHKPGKEIFINSHTSSTPIDLYEIPHILYTNNPRPLSSGTNWILLIYTHTHSRLKSSLADIISDVDDFSDPWDPNTTILMEEMCGLQGELC